MEDNCIFCKIVQKNIPSEIVYEDDNFIAFLDIHPKSSGHTLLIPKIHYRWVIDIPNIGQFFEVAKKISLDLKEKYQADYIIMNIIGTDIPHAHVHLIPQKL